MFPLSKGSIGTCQTEIYAVSEHYTTGFPRIFPIETIRRNECTAIGIEAVDAASTVLKKGLQKIH